MNKQQLKAYGAMFGVAIGDALGATLEFMSRNEIIQKYGRLKDIIGGGFWKLLPGEVTDDTNMTIAVAQGIIGNPGDPLEKIAEFFVEWFKTEPKDIGNICRIVLAEGAKGVTKEVEWLKIAQNAHIKSGGRSAGNGSLMRTMPVVIAYLNDKEKMIDIACRQSALTHFDMKAGQCVSIYCQLVRELINGGDLKAKIIETVRETPVDITINLLPEQIDNSGYVVSTLEAALNCAYQTESFEEALIMAVNLGGDADTIGAVTGGIVGSYYGLDQIPERWLNELTVRDCIYELTQELLSISETRQLYRK